MVEWWIFIAWCVAVLVLLVVQVVAAGRRADAMVAKTLAKERKRQEIHDLSERFKAYDDWAKTR